MTGNLDRDDVLSHIVPVVSAERHPGNPGAQESAPCLVLTPARQLALSKQALVLCSLLGTDVDDDDVKLAHDAAPLKRPYVPKARLPPVTARRTPLSGLTLASMGFTSPPPIVAGLRASDRQLSPCCMTSW